MTHLWLTFIRLGAFKSARHFRRTKAQPDFFFSVLKMACEPIIITQTSGESYGLAELLRAWQIAPEFSQGISERWQCEIVPTATSEEEIRQHVLDGTPVLVPSEYGRRACEQVGDDALHYLTGCSERNMFPRPKIAFVAGWGRPGSQLADDEELQLVDSFQSVLEQSESGKPLNLQMFHRDDEGAPRIPQLPAALEWPLPDLFGMDNGEAPRTTPTCNTSTENSRSCAGECQGGRGALLRYPCDMATRVSARGALTWWHLDDGGEFVIQVVILLEIESCQIFITIAILIFAHLK